MIRIEQLAAHLLAIAISVSLLGAAAEAQTSPQQASAFIQDMGAQAVMLLANYDDTDARGPGGRFDELIQRGFDLEAIGRYALGASWERATTEQRREYQTLFATWTTYSYARRLGANKGGSLAVVGAEPFAGTDALVRTRIILASGLQRDVDLRVRGTQGRMKIVDVVMGGVSLDMTQRAEFSSVIEHQGLDGLIAGLRTKVHDLDIKTAQQQ
jgi:phospholipid transport system substrate-binding protein